jgi:cellulose synthase/poly-beta-1,6-N-acetylglucosamine synthase-like glycosyltransferase
VTPIAVVIPALNEAERIATCVRSAVRQPGAQVLVVDGVSTDGTPEIARRWAPAIRSRRGRAAQMNAGARCTAAEILLFRTPTAFSTRTPCAGCVLHLPTRQRRAAPSPSASTKIGHCYVSTP